MEIGEVGSVAADRTDDYGVSRMYNSFVPYTKGENKQSGSIYHFYGGRRYRC
ncbi:uncharacterized protein PHALS_03326 [Plasmopara halstedii]|uniref:Uncharacterized protein n=1 Tax=Plasmopara halstedii TaxID=4781 RepID=A0A0P1A8M6_PLAHL|nr:uncharacterized protein PHALS_03326 [Plasmopara halstedii]CEG36656.1 hypothetical protein PHALS_03326 [Plasmopara halstedii]|eukprot:XP_024573025.1 hypothetical protein PHALS_03326 [Plasmopara halstedii]